VKRQQIFAVINGCFQHNGFVASVCKAIHTVNQMHYAKAFVQWTLDNKMQ